MPRARSHNFRDRRAAAEAAAPRACDHPGCDQSGDYRAPKAREPEAGHYWFCLPHVRNYNAAWNFFSGMSQREIEDYQQGNATWHRPTWYIGSAQSEGPSNRGWYDPLDLLRAAGLATEGRAAAEEPPPSRRMAPAERKALADLDLGPTVTLQQIKSRYKQLAKRFHPDANGGCKKAEEKLKRINLAYSYLLTCGYS